MSVVRVAVVGGGIGGLTLALALRQRGMRAEVYEQAAELAEIGAAVALSSNATRELGRLGLLPALDAVSCEPTELIWRRWDDGARIAAHPVRDGHAYRERFGGPYYGIHRADLQRILGGALGGEGLHLGHRVSAVEAEGETAALTFTNGSRVEADLVVGADGVRSMVRRFVAPDVAGAAYSGTSAFRGIVPTAGLRHLPDPHAIQFWMGPGAHLLHYAIGADGGHVNYFAVVEGPADWPAAGGTRPIAPGEALAAFAGWHPAVTEMIGAAAQTVRWGLMVTPYMPEWFRGRAVLLGDAVHAMVPHHGQGANTTIEDAVVLAALLAGRTAADVAEVLPRYQALRRGRTRRIQRSAWMTNRLLHLPDGDAETGRRDAGLAAFPERFGWIHAFDAAAMVSQTARPEVE